MWVVYFYFFWSSSPLSWLSSRMLISHWLIACNVVDVVMLSLSLSHTLHSIEMFLKSTEWWWWKFYINFPLFHFSSIVVYIAMRTREWLKKNIFWAYLKSDENVKQKIPNLWIVFQTFSLEFSSSSLLSVVAFRWNFFYEKIFFIIINLLSTTWSQKLHFLKSNSFIHAPMISN